MKDRSNYPVRMTTLAEQRLDDDLRGLSPSELMAMVWPLTVKAWEMIDPQACHRPLRRDIVNFTRNQPGGDTGSV